MILRRRAAAPRAAQPPSQLWSGFAGYLEVTVDLSSCLSFPKSYLASFFHPGVFMFFFFFFALLHHEGPFRDGECTPNVKMQQRLLHKKNVLRQRLMDYTGDICFRLL